MQYLEVYWALCCTSEWSPYINYCASKAFALGTKMGCVRMIVALSSPASSHHPLVPRNVTGCQRHFSDGRKILCIVIKARNEEVSLD
jgi:hypothetical protein